MAISNFRKRLAAVCAFALIGALLAFAWSRREPARPAA